jgi:ABC-type polysaccharide/polyol phosphate export permease
MSSIVAPVYDSAQRPFPLVREVGNAWRYRRLLGVLVVRDVTVRYKRSALGVWWTLLNPLLTTAVMWVVFSQVFRFATGATPYLVYLLSGLVVVTFFSTAVLGVAGSLLRGSAILSKLYVPPELFAVAAAAVAVFDLAISLIPLLIVQAAYGVGIPWTLLLLPIPVLCLAAFAAGIGLALAPAAVRFGDVVQLTTVGLYLIGLLTPSFYPISAVARQFHHLLELNPLYHHLLVFRSLAYGGTLGPWWAWVVMIGASALSVAGGGALFSRGWPRAVVAL